MWYFTTGFSFLAENSALEILNGGKLVGIKISSTFVYDKGKSAKYSGLQNNALTGHLITKLLGIFTASLLLEGNTY